MLGKVFSTKAWLIIAGLMHLVMGVILQTFQSDMVAEMGWGDAVGPHDAMYEYVIGMCIFPQVAAMAAMAFLLKGGLQAKFTAIFGGAAVISFVGIAAYTSGKGYMAEMGAMGAFAPPVTLFVLLTISGVVHWNDED